MLADEGENGAFNPRTKRLDSVIGERKAVPLVGVQIANGRMRAKRRKRERESPCRDRKNHVQKSIERMRRVALRYAVSMRSRARGRRSPPLRRDARRADAPAKSGRVGPCEPRRLRFGDHRLLHALRPPRRRHESGGVAHVDCARPRRAGYLRLNDANRNRQWVRLDLSAKHRGAGAGASRQDRHEIAHPVQGDNRDTMRPAKAHRFDGDDAAPSGHDDGCRHARTGVISKVALAVADIERPAFDGQARVVGFGRYDARLDRKAGLPKAVAFRVGFRIGQDSLSRAC